MRIVIQRCAQASVTIHHQVEAAIEKGLVILLGIEESDTQEDANWLIHKVINLRIFDDEQGVMNRSIQDIQGEMLVVSQFTLFASYKKGNHPALPTLLRRTVAPVGPKSANRHVWCRHESGTHQRWSRNDLHG